MRMIVVAASLLAPMRLGGQRLPPAWPSVRLSFSTAQTTLRTSLLDGSRTIPHTYWLEGAVIGAGGLGTLVAVEFHGLCESRNCTGVTIGGAMLGGAVGFTVGALVGGQFRKRGTSASQPP
jgi:hypothetical protein